MNAFWESKSLHDMDEAEWESLCDGCGRCCLTKLEDNDTGEVFFTNVACKLLDTDTCRCGDYTNRKQRVPACFVLDAESLSDYSYLPPTCAYRLLSTGKSLPHWHPLITGTPDSVHQAGISVRGKVVSERYVDDSELQDRIVSWPVETG
ncbi:MAG: YcgN family cysteine cluster protein [Acidiferrobacterales bacterium]